MKTENRRLKHDLAGQTFGRWTVLQHISHGFWTCVCECGNTSKVNGKFLRAGKSKSCGCYKPLATRRKSLRHGHTTDRKATPEYNAYQNMLKRCLDPKSERYPQYGGRGIEVCASWRDGFANFLADMGERPSPRHSLDRIEVNGNYEKSNCRWALVKVQSRNKTNTIMVDMGGRTIPLAEACEILGLKYGTVHNRIRRYGMTAEEAIQFIAATFGITPEQAFSQEAA